MLDITAHHGLSSFEANAVCSIASVLPYHTTPQERSTVFAAFTDGQGSTPIIALIPTNTRRLFKQSNSDAVRVPNLLFFALSNAVGTFLLSYRAVVGHDGTDMFIARADGSPTVTDAAAAPR